MERVEQNPEEPETADERAAMVDRSVIDRLMTLAFGANRDATHWKNETRGTSDQFFTWLETPDPDHHEKDGLAYLQGSLKPGKTRRQADSMDSLSIIAFDVESGELPDPILDNAEALGIELVIYPTFNDGKPETRIATDRLNRWAKLGALDEANEQQVFAYLKEVRGFQTWVLEAAKFAGRDGQEYVVAHEPLRRFRVVAVWNEPVVLTNLAPTLAGIKEKWEQAYYQVGRMLGIQHFDKSCTDLSRLFYTHRRPKGAEPWCYRVINGKPLDFVAILAEVEAAQPEPAKTTTVADNTPGRQKYATPELGRFFARCGKHFNAADFLAAYGDDPVEANGGVAARCPNEHGSNHSAGHSEEDPPGKRSCWGMNAVDANSSVGFIKCQHATCKDDLKSPHYMDLLCAKHGLTVNDLLNFVTDEGREAWADDDKTFDVDQAGRPYPSQHNIRFALRKLGAVVRYNEFAGKVMIRWNSDYEEVLQDSHVVDLWLSTEREYNFRPSKDYFFDVVGMIARGNRFHTVREYVDDVQARWDGVPRVERFFSTYFSAKDDAFNRAAAKCWMVAAVRRVREPGVKFDEMIVLESAQGKGKSAAFAVLAVRSEWFTDSLALGASGKEVIEQTRGKWIIEVPELHGMRKADIDRVKAQLSRQKDEARLAYGRITESVPRQFVFAGNSNNRNYLKDKTGNRRFWPIATNDIDQAALLRDRDQLWGEAATLEAQGESIRLDRSLWETAAKVQAERLEENPFLDVLAEHLGDAEGGIRSVDLWRLLKVSADRAHPEVIDKVHDAMKRLGWGEKRSIKWQSRSTKGWRKGPAGDLIVDGPDCAPELKKAGGLSTLGRGAGRRRFPGGDRPGDP